MKYFDAHCHLNMKPLLEQFESITNEMKVCHFGANVVGFDIDSSWKAIELTKSQGIFATIGVHPCDIDKNIEYAKEQLGEMLLESSKIIAIGETGFDFFHTKKSNSLYNDQLKWLNMHYEIAKKHDLALMIHIRDGHEEMIEWVRQKKYHKVIIHCFNKSFEIAQQYLELGCYLSIPGVVTYKNAQELQLAITQIPLDRILIETDAPFLSPVPYRGKTNMPQYSIEIYKKIAELKNIPFEHLAEAVLENNKRIFKI